MRGHQCCVCCPHLPRLQVRVFGMGFRAFTASDPNGSKNVCLSHKTWCLWHLALWQYLRLPPPHAVQDGPGGDVHLRLCITHPCTLTVITPSQACNEWDSLAALSMSVHEA